MPPEVEQALSAAPPDPQGYVYLIRSASGHYKIGHSQNPNGRVAALSTPFDLELIHVMPSNDPRWGESMLHRHFASKRVRGEWFMLDQQDVASILATKRCDRPGWVGKPKGFGKDATHKDRHTSPRVVFHLPRELLAALDQFARENGRTRTAQIIRALEDYYRGQGKWPPPGEKLWPPPEPARCTPV